MHKVGWWWLRGSVHQQKEASRVSVCGIPFFVKWKKSGWSIEKNDNTGEWNSRLADEAGFIPRCCCIKKTSMPTLQTLSYRRESRSKKGSVVRPLTAAAVVALLLFSRRRSSSSTYYKYISPSSVTRRPFVRSPFGNFYLILFCFLIPPSIRTIIIIINAQMGKGRNYSTFAAGLSFFKPW